MSKKKLKNFVVMRNEFEWAKDMYITAQRKGNENMEEAIPYYIEARDLACIAFYYADKIICELHDAIRTNGISDKDLNYYTDFIKTEYANEIVRIIEHCDEIISRHFPEEKKERLNDNEAYRMFRLLSVPVYV